MSDRREGSLRRPEEKETAGALGFNLILCYGLNRLMSAAMQKIIRSTFTLVCSFCCHSGLQLILF